MMEQEPKLTQDYTTETRTTVAAIEGFHEDADMRVKFVTDTISSWSVGDFKVIQARMVFDPSFSELDEEQILGMLDGALKSIYAQKERIPEFIATLDNVLHHYLDRGNGGEQTKEPDCEA
ncbi:hypothetical protein M3_0087 [Lysinibacillus phage vB_LfM_LysYB1]|nr:hypothetical protein M3_0087 [Lysinibacillus phage vB_LfM_LysYB1]WAB25404.1 hypothetical protein M5_0226 [Lysinibacillus phage vB_LfM_LysYB2]